MQIYDNYSEYKYFLHKIICAIYSFISVFRRIKKTSSHETAVSSHEIQISLHGIFVPCEEILQLSAINRIYTTEKSIICSIIL